MRKNPLIKISQVIADNLKMRTYSEKYILVNRDGLRRTGTTTFSQSVIIRKLGKAYCRYHMSTAFFWNKVEKIEWKIYNRFWAERDLGFHIPITNRQDIRCYDLTHWKRFNIEQHEEI